MNNITTPKTAQTTIGKAAARPNYYKRKAARDRRAFLLFIAPAVFVFSLMLLWPLLNMFYLGFVEWKGILKPQTYIGLENYWRLFSDRHFHRALVNTGMHLMISMPGVMLPAFMLGFFLSLRRTGYRILRTIFFLPAMISVTALAMMFVGVYMPEGILNAFLSGVGLESWTRPWLGNPTTVMPAIILIDLYSGIGFYAVLFSAALAGVPMDLYESARLDGAGQWTIMWRIGFPLILDFFGVACILHLMWILLGASQRVLLLTAGGPGDYSLTLGYYLYEQAFKTQRLGYSQAIGVVIFFIGALGIMVIRQTTRRDYQQK
ncbi:MAG: L-arabinose transport system permease protein AraP [Anaerolineae bacterium]|nr:L-arabinose transport system permease protein AraP [Anaerolineae bacterium]